MATMQDVARHAGVSPMTVSNVVNGHPHVREATRERVLQSIAALGYHVNTAARNLRQGRTGVIGLAVPDIDRPYFGLLAGLLIERAAARGFEFVIEQTAARRERELDAIDRSRLRSYDGLILSAVQLHDDDAMLLQSDFPIVVLGERSYSSPLDRVVMANEQGAAMAAAHLIDVGCTQLAMIGGRTGAPDDIDVETLRARGFSDTARQRGLELRPDLIRSVEFSFEGGYRAMSQLLDDGETVDGIFCATDVIAIGAMRALYERGVRVPDEVCIVGFDDVTLASFLTPSLTTMSPDHSAMADAAMTMLIDRITGTRGADQYETVVGAVTLMQRESTSR